MLPRTSHTRRHTRLKRHQAKPAVGHLWPNKPLIAYLARCEQRLDVHPGHRGRRGDRPI
jgi:hypothetical protein